MLILQKLQSWSYLWKLTFLLKSASQRYNWHTVKCTQVCSLMHPDNIQYIPLNHYHNQIFQDLRSLFVKSVFPTPGNHWVVFYHYRFCRNQFENSIKMESLCTFFLSSFTQHMFLRLIHVLCTLKFILFFFFFYIITILLNAHITICLSTHLFMAFVLPLVLGYFE